MRLACLSVRQPYASAILTGQKREEFRSWPTRHRGPLAVHAGRTLELDAFGDFPNFRPGRVVRGAVLGLVEVVGCEPDGGGRFAWVLARPRWLARPFPLAGRLGLFGVELPAELLVEIDADRRGHAPTVEVALPGR
jgi:hypothetical protein